MADIIDSRELITELDELRELVEMNEADQDDLARISAIEELEREVGGEWDYGATLIPESEFEDYARQTAEDIGAIDPDAGWPLHCIDWEWAARELRMDYTSVTFDGDDYLVRA